MALTEGSSKRKKLQNSLGGIKAYMSQTFRSFILLMVQKSGINSPVEGRGSLSPIIYQVCSTIQKVVFVFPGCFFHHQQSDLPQKMEEISFFRSRPWHPRSQEWHLHDFSGLKGSARSPPGRSTLTAGVGALPPRWFDSVEVDRRGLPMPLWKSKSWGPQFLGGRLWSTQVDHLFVFALWAFEERIITRIQYPSNTQIDLKTCRLSVTPHGSELQCSTLKLETSDFLIWVKADGSDSHETRLFSDTGNPEREGPSSHRRGTLHVEKLWATQSIDWILTVASQMFGFVEPSSFTSNLKPSTDVFVIIFS